MLFYIPNTMCGKYDTFFSGNRHNTVCRRVPLSLQSHRANANSDKVTYRKSKMQKHSRQQTASEKGDSHFLSFMCADELQNQVTPFTRRTKNNKPPSSFDTQAHVCVTCCPFDLTRIEAKHF